jgi:non-ribosomal peptide synthetase component F
VIGILAIEMAGGAYCPLSPRDPEHRLKSLIKETEGRTILIHHLTKTKFDKDITTVNIDLILNDGEAKDSIDMNRLGNVSVTPENLAYIIFTSGSTGTPKAVSS